jgi:hypothetical protein
MLPSTRGMAGRPSRPTPHRPVVRTPVAGLLLMRSRTQILTNLETAYREQFERAKGDNQSRRMEELDAGYLRDQLMLEVLLVVRVLLSRAR